MHTPMVWRITFILFTSFFLGACNTPWSSGDEANSVSRSSTGNPFNNSNIMFDWNVQTDEFICSGIGANNNLISVGVEFDPNNINKNVVALEVLQKLIEKKFSGAVLVVGREPRLSTLSIEMIDCSVLSSIRALPSVQFVEAKYVTPFSIEDMVEQAFEIRPNVAAYRIDEAILNPGDYRHGDFDIPYLEFVKSIDEAAADRIDRHRVNEIYEDFGFYGSPTVGVAILDNGVFESRVDYLSQGGGFFEMEGYVRPFGAIEVDGPHPQPYDLFGLLPSIPKMYAHGTIQTSFVYTVAPNINIKSVRGASFVFWFMPSQFQGAVDSILALAEDPSIRVLSSSMGTVIYVHEIERAIDYFNAQDKLYVSAAGTSAKFIKNLVNVVFPANLSSTISVTGIEDTMKTNGDFVLGRDAHGGLEMDFVVDYSEDSSQSASSIAGMIGLIWSYNPSLSREDVIDILIQSSSNYRLIGKKDPVFGWGKVDMYDAFIAVKKTLVE